MKSCVFPRSLSAAAAPALNSFTVGPNDCSSHVFMRSDASRSQRHVSFQDSSVPETCFPGGSASIEFIHFGPQLCVASRFPANLFLLVPYTCFFQGSSVPETRFFPGSLSAAAAAPAFNSFTFGPNDVSPHVFVPSFSSRSQRHVSFLDSSVPETCFFPRFICLIDMFLSKVAVRGGRASI